MFGSVVCFLSSSDNRIVVDVIIPLFEVVEMSIGSSFDKSGIVNDARVVDRALRRVERRIESFRNHSDRVSIGQLVTKKKIPVPEKKTRNQSDTISSSVVTDIY